MNAGNLQIDVPVGTTVLGGPPPVPSGSFFRTIANLVFATKRGTATFNMATIANGTTEHCTADGLALAGRRAEPPAGRAESRID